MKDIYDGDLVHVWEDESVISMAFPWVTLNIPSEDWGRLVTDLKNLVVVVKEAEIKELKELFDERKN